MDEPSEEPSSADTAYTAETDEPTEAAEATEATATTADPGGRHGLRGVPRRLALDAGSRWALLLIAIGVLVRLGLALLNWPPTDSDEGTMGLMAFHIASRGAHPLFFYGQTYMGTLQAYIGAALFSVFGVSVFSLRLGLLLLFTLFLATMYVLLRLLYGRAFALFSLVLLDLGGPELLKPQLLALGGYPETLLFGALSLLLATWLALGARSDRSDAAGQPRWLRLAAYAGFGLTLGLGWWSDPLVLPFLVAAVILLAALCARDLFRGGLAAVALGLVIGLLPQIAFAIQHRAGGGPTAVAAFQPQGIGTLAQLPATLVAQLLGTLFISLPDITGPGWLCASSIGHDGAPLAGSGAGGLACVGLRAGWSLGLLALGAIATAAALSAWWGARMSGRVNGYSRDGYRASVSHAGRLAVLLGGWLALVMYIVSPAAVPPGHTRYLIGMIIALPAMVYPLWAAAFAPSSILKARPGSWMRQTAICQVCLGLMTLALAGGVVSTYMLAPAAHAQYAADQRLIHDLDRLGVRHMYTDYWTCYKVAFLTEERITCDALNSTLGQGNNRYPPYVTAVEADLRAAYVFPTDSPQAAAFAQARTPRVRFVQISLNRYVVYLPGSAQPATSERYAAR